MIQTAKTYFRRCRKIIIRFWRLHAVVPQLLRFNAYTGFIGRRVFQYIPFVLPHDKSYYGFAHLVEPKKGLFLDIGANDGISAIGFHHIHNDYQIISLEPNRSHERSLQRLTKKLKGFSYLIVGAGENAASLTMHVPFFQGVPIYTAASIDKAYVEASMRKQFGSAINAVAYEQMIIKIVPIDELNLSPDIIKVDTEGYELEVLKGAKQTIQRCKPYILIEFNEGLFDEQGDFLSTHGYEFFRYDFRRDIFTRFSLQKSKGILNKVEAMNIFCIPTTKLGTIPVEKS